METKTDRSFGVIPYIYEKGEPKFLVIHQYSHWRGDSFWTFPKGHPEADESGTEAAMRELYEETGLTLRSLNTEHPILISYSFVHERTRIEKTVTLYLGNVIATPMSLQESEIHDAKWCTYETAYELLTHENAKQVLEKAYRLVL